jgi:hypothetical protein
MDRISYWAVEINIIARLAVRKPMMMNSMIKPKAVHAVNG